MVWEVCHRLLGRGALLLALVQISLGVFLAVSHKIVWATWFGYVGVIVLFYIIAELNKKCKDTSSYETKGPSSDQNNKRYILRNSAYGISSKGPHCYENPALESEG